MRLWVLGSLLGFFFAARVVAEPVVAVVGAGPAGMALTEQLNKQGVSVILLEGASYVGGNVAHGYFYTKDYRPLLAQYRELTLRQGVRFFGHVRVGTEGPVSLASLAQLPLDGIVFTSGAKPAALGIPGEQYAVTAPQVFYYYNGHENYPVPPVIGKRVVVVGSGSSAIDLVKYLLMQNRGLHITILVRRGPGQYGYKHLRYFINNLVGALSRKPYEKELTRIASELAAAGEDPAEYLKRYFESSHKSKEYPPEAGTVEILHLVSPTRIIDEGGRVTGIELERNHLVRTPHGIGAIPTGERFVFPADTVITSLGGAIDSSLGLPVEEGRVVTKNREDRAIRRDSDVPEPEKYFASRLLDHYRVDFSGAAEKPPMGVYVAGWARLPGIGASDETELFSNIPDGRTAGKLLVPVLPPSPAGKLEVVARQLQDMLNAKRCPFLLEAQAPPEKRPHLDGTS